MSNDGFSLTTIQVRAAQDGDATAMEALFERYLPRVTRIVAARLGRDWRDLVVSDDVVQETFLDACAALRDGKIQDEAAFCGWIARCVQNNVHDQQRRELAARRGGGRVERFADLPESLLADSILDGGHDTPSTLASAQESEARLEQILLSLNARYREVISLRAYCGMGFADIATTMGLRNQNTANVMFLRAREEIRRRLSAKEV